MYLTAATERALVKWAQEEGEESPRSSVGALGVQDPVTLRPASSFILTHAFPPLDGTRATHLSSQAFPVMITIIIACT